MTATGKIIRAGETVCHLDEAHPMRIGLVVGHGPKKGWIRVKTNDGKTRIWDRKNVSILDDETLSVILSH